MATEELFCTLFEQCSAMTLLFDADLLLRADQDGRILDLISFTQEQLYLPADDYPGKTFTDIYPKKAADIIMSALAEASETGRHHGSTYSLIMPQGVKWYELSIAAIGNLSQKRHCIVRSQDITTRRRNEDALREQTELARQSKERLTNIIYGANLGTWELHVPTGAMIVNERWAELIGFTLEEVEPVTRKFWHNRMHSLDRLSSTEILERHVQGKVDFYEFECRMQHKSGNWIWILIRGKIISQHVDGSPLIMSGTCMDITQRKNAENLVLIQQQQLESMNVDLSELVQEEIAKSQKKDLMLMQQDKLAAVGKLAAGVAHEINNPMSFISANLKILHDYFQKVIRYDEQILVLAHQTPASIHETIDLNRKTQKIAQIVDDGIDLIRESLEGVERITKIVHDLKWFSRVDAEELERVELSACLESAVEICSSEINSVATLRKEYSATPPVLCHSAQMNQVFLNLLVNACHAITPPGEITLRCWHDAASVHVSISDTGSGIPADIRDQIFDPFFTTKDVGIGTGLGLSVSKEIIKLNHGDIFVESTEGKGSTFTVVLPLESPEPYDPLPDHGLISYSI